MKMKKIVSFIMVGILSISTMACGDKKEKEEVNKESSVPKIQLRVGVMGSIDALPLVIAKENNYFSELGIDLDLQIFTAAKDRDAALQAGELDGVLADEVAISIYQNSGIDMKITGTTNGSWTLVAGKDSGIKTIKDIKGKSIGISERTMIDYLAYYVATENGLKESDIEKVAIPAMPTRLEALKNGQIDAAILPAPFNDKAIADGGIEITKIYNKDIMISTTAFLQSVIDEKGKAVSDFYKAYDKGIEELNKSGIDKYEDIIIKTVGYSEDMKGSITLPEFKKNYLPDEKKVQKVFDWSKNSKIIEKSIKAKDVMNGIGVN